MPLKFCFKNLSLTTGFMLLYSLQLILFLLFFLYTWVFQSPTTSFGCAVKLRSSFIFFLQ
jgi:hypothetical protein